ncbi:MAG: hypothetical protein WCO52_00870 [bacterium]
MHTFRYNPVFRQWVLLGSPVATPLEVTDAQLLNIGRGTDLVAASYPRQPFILDPGSKRPESDQRLYSDEPAVGDYELFLYGGKKHFFEWQAKQWEEWLVLAQHRIIQLHHNPHLHYVSLILATSALDTVKGYQRVGDLVSTSHPVAGEIPLMTHELADKLLAKERSYIVHEGKHGSLRVPSAPLGEQEVWYVPTEYERGIEQMGAAGRKECATVLAKLVSSLHTEFPRAQYVLTVYTAMASHKEETTWWIRISRENASAADGAIGTRAFPEGFLRTLGMILGS